MWIFGAAATTAAGDGLEDVIVSSAQADKSADTAKTGRRYWRSIRHLIL